MPSKKRIPDWKEEFKQRNRRAVRARSAYEANPPTFEERETELLKCLAHYDLDIEERPEPKHRGTASTDEGDSLSMRAKSIVSKLLPRRGVNKGAILRWMRERFPGICWHEINPALNALVHKGRVVAVCGPSPATVRPQRLPEILRAGRYWFLTIGAGKPDSNTAGELPLLSSVASAVYDILIKLPPHRGLPGPAILTALEESKIFIEQSSLTSRIIPELKPYGIENVHRKGYRIPKSKRPPTDAA